ncbi:unnamed protein product [Pylaiella littoralis]
MADAARAEDAEVEKAKEAVSGMVVEGVKEDIGVGERKGRKRSGKAGKPNFATTGVRQKWDQCVGMDVDEAMDLISEERPDLKKVIKVKEGSMVTMDMRSDRVRLFYNAQGVVTRAPKVG